MKSQLCYFILSNRRHTIYVRTIGHSIHVFVLSSTDIYEKNLTDDSSPWDSNKIKYQSFYFLALVYRMFVTTLIFQMFHSMNSRFQLQCRSISVVLTRSFTVLNHFNVENQIKSFNDQKNYLAALTLFDRYKNEQRPTDRMIVQALKACTKLKNVERGRSIHEKLPPATLLNEFIQSTLINFYSQSKSSIFFSTFDSNRFS